MFFSLTITLIFSSESSNYSPFFYSQTNNPNNLMSSNVSTSGQSQNSEETITLYAGGAGSNENSRSGM